MAGRNRWRTVFGTGLAFALVLAGLTGAAFAQDEPETQGEQTVSQTEPEPPPPAKVGPDPGPFRKGKVRVGFYAGAGSSYNQTYIILGAGAGYYLMNGLEAGIDLEGWLFQDPEYWKVTPQVRYVVWKMNPLKPYIGAFWRKTFVGGGFDDYNSWGARGGVAYRNGGNYLAVGVVYEKYSDFNGIGDDYAIYPEFAFWISF
jgi:hypothetical protein